MSHKLRNLIFIILILFIIGIIVWYFIFNKKEVNNITENNIVNNNLEDSTDEKQIQKEVKIIYPDNYENDKDSDGINDVEEEKLGTSKWEPDTDGDGLLDKKEIEEYKTDPTNPDTDGDGYWDGLEVVNGYDPLK